MACHLMCDSLWHLALRPTTEAAARRPLAESALIASGAQPAWTRENCIALETCAVREGGQGAEGFQTATSVVGFSAIFCGPLFAAHSSP